MIGRLLKMLLKKGAIVNIPIWEPGVY